jgi:hypothetical protein
MKFLKYIIFITAFSTLGACEKQADLNNIEQYTKDGVSFSIPGNWSVTEDIEEDGFRYVFVETSGDAIVTVNTYLKEKSFPLREYVEWTIESSTNEMPVGSRNEGTISEIQTLIDEQTFQGYKNQFVVSLAGIEVPHIAEFYAKGSNSKIAYISSQVANEDLSKVQKGFELILSTFSIQ